MSEDLMAVLIGERTLSLHGAVVAAFGLEPAQALYDWPQAGESAVELTPADLLARLLERPDADYDVYMRSPEAEGVVIGFRPGCLLLGLPWSLGRARIEAFAQAEFISDGYLWSDDPLPDNRAEAQTRRWHVARGRVWEG